MSSSRIPMRESLFIREQLNHLANFNGLNTVERSLHGWFLAPFLDRREDLPFRLPCLSSSFRFSILPWNHPFRRGLINRSVVYSPSDHHRYDPFLGSKGKIPILFYDASNPANLQDRWRTWMNLPNRIACKPAEKTSFNYFPCKLPFVNIVPF